MTSIFVENAKRPLKVLFLMQFCSICKKNILTTSIKNPNLGFRATGTSTLNLCKNDVSLKCPMYNFFFKFGTTVVMFVRQKHIKFKNFLLPVLKLPYLLD